MRDAGEMHMTTTDNLNHGNNRTNIPGRLRGVLSLVGLGAALVVALHDTVQKVLGLEHDYKPEEEPMH